jgi:putative OPT family oligopeptide transporter
MENRAELTLRGFLLGAAITLVFTAANVYLGLKVGLTFASSIPAAVISMAVLRAFRNATIYENNIVQTVASAAGTLSAVIFVLPGLVMIGWWSGFPFLQSFGICAIGGILGVMYSVPLRRALVTGSNLPYPEGVAAAEVLKVGTGAGAATERNRAGLLALLTGSLASAAFAAIVATKLFAGTLAGYVRVGNATTGAGFSLSLALAGAGQLIGITVGLAIFAGLVIAWGVATPLLSAFHPAPGAAADVATAIWSHQVRFIGAGAIGVAALWSLGRLARPVALGVSSAIVASRRRREASAFLPRTEQDLPIGVVALVSLLCLVPLAILFWSFLSNGQLAPVAILMTLAAVAYVVIAGFFVAAACGYMAGLIGSSNSPVSGLAILSVIGAALIVLAIGAAFVHTAATAMIAYALFVTAVLLCVATISNDNLQDLKTGQLVDATPWRQQVALAGGVAIGALVIPPILNLLAHAYGFAGSVAAHTAVGQPLPAPQATLISALAKGVIARALDWNLIGTGALVGVLIVVADELLKLRKGFALPPLAVGLGIYLPPSTTAPVVLGAILGWAYNRWSARQPYPDRAKQLGILVASGLIVGESLFGVLLAGLIVASGNAAPLGLVGDAFAPLAEAIGAAAFLVALGGLFAGLSRLSGTFGGGKGTIRT